MKKDSIIINSTYPEYDILGYDDVLESPIYELKSVTVNFTLKNNSEFNGEYKIATDRTLSEEKIKDKIINGLKEN